VKPKIITALFLTILYSGYAFGQTSVIKLSFTAVDIWQHVQLDKIYVKNVDKDCDTTLFWPDTTLTLNTLGINEQMNHRGFHVLQNTPNPVREKTIIKVCIPEKGPVRIQVSDVSGRIILALNQNLGQGNHSFEFTPCGKQVYFFTSKYEGEARTIKIIADNQLTINDCSLNYQGIERENNGPKGSYSTENFLFSPGDSLEMTGYIGEMTDLIRDNPTTGKTYTFTFSSNSPIVSTTSVTNITQNTAKSGGKVISEGGTNVNAKGVCWSTLSNPTINDSKTIDGGGIGEFISFVTGLNANTTYYLRAYAINNSGTSYGLQEEFTTLPEVTIPSLITAPVSNTTNISAQSGGTITNDGGSTVLSRGVCWSTNSNPTLLDTHTTDGSGSGTFVSQMTNLAPITFYYVRAYATNSAGTAYGNQQTFSTLENPIMPLVSTAQVINITTTNATSGGNVASDGGAAVTARGVCWSTSPSPTTSDSHTNDGIGTGIFVSTLSGLNPNTLYYVRAYATNSVGTAYGNEVTFTSLAEATFPTVITDQATSIAQTTAISGGNVTSNGGAVVTVRGVCWSTNQNPTTNDNKTIDGSGTGTFTSYLTGLNANTIYYIRAYATNSVGTAYGNEVSFTTLQNPVLPTVTTAAITDITTTTATSGGDVTWDGGANVTARGVCWSTSTNPTVFDSHTTDGTGTGTFVSYLTGLTPNTLYYVRAYATNSVGTGYGNELIFTTGQTVTSPVVTTANVTNIAQSSATSGGTVTSDGGATVTARGVCWGVSPNPTTANSFTNDGTGTGTFISNLTGLSPNTLYYLRAYATNSVGTAYGNEVIFTTLVWSCGSTITINHVTGNVAPVNKTVTYGTVTNIPGEPSKCWITSNLGADHQATAVDDATEASAGWYWQFNRKQGYKHDGTTRTPNSTWITSINENLDWQTTNDPCALELGTGWRIPTKIEWENVDASGNWTNWNGPWNSSLKLHAAGHLNISDGSLNYRSIYGYYWSNKQEDAMGAWYLLFSNNYCSIPSDSKANGLSLRCIKENSSFTCGTPITISHLAGNIAPVTKTVTYGTVTNIPGEPTKCWITSNLGSDHQATAVNDATEASAGWYWQFNRKQGYKHDGTTRTPNTSWISAINETSEWQSTNDPCIMELGTGWRLPTASEWMNVDAFGTWTTWTGPWNSLLKMHAAGYLDNSNGSLNNRGLQGQYWSSSENSSTQSWYLLFSTDYCGLNLNAKAYGGTLRCLKDISTFSCGTSLTINHLQGTVAPVTKTVTYSTVENIPGEISKCWITSNLGSDHQATAVNDATEPSAGWYWQFNRKQGYKHDGTIRTPNSTWITLINENSDWIATNDPCSILLGGSWRIPSKTEWENVDAGGNWLNWNGPWNSNLKIHAAGNLNSGNGSLGNRGSGGYYWSCTQYSSTIVWWLLLSNSGCGPEYSAKEPGVSLRCLNSSLSIVPPTVTTIVATNITLTTATSGGNVVSGGGAAITARGVCWSTSPNPTTANSHTNDGIGIGSFISNMTGLTPSTLYYVRAYATNSVGTAYGNEISFSTIATIPNCGDLVTYEGKNYPTIQIGTQCWFKENLNVGTMINGSQTQTNNGIKEKYCFDDLESNCNVYGGLYQWNEMMQYTTAPGAQGICPNGWHLPTDNEFTILSNYLGGTSFAGGKMKESGFANWNAPNTGATNESGFTGLPGGLKETSLFNDLHTYNWIWTSSLFNSDHAASSRLDYDNTYFLISQTGYLVTGGLSVRCIKN